MTLATTWSAPLLAPAFGDSDVVAKPVESVSAVVTLNAPSPPGDEKLTTWPDTPAPVASLSVALTVTGALGVAVELDRDTVRLAVAGVVPPVPGVVPVDPDLPPPQAAIPAINKIAAIPFMNLIEPLLSFLLASHASQISVPQRCR